MISKIMSRRVTDAVIRKALSRNDKFEWTDDDQKNLESFMLGATGSKLMAHLESVLQAMLLDASSEEDPQKALHKMATSKGFSLAIGAIRLSMPKPFLTEEVSPEASDPFMIIQSQPTVF